MATLQAPTRFETAASAGRFRNEPILDFSREENARLMRAAIEKVRSQLGREYDLVIGGKRLRTADKINSINPAKPSQVVGIHQKAGREQAEPAVQAAVAAFEEWKRVSAEERAGLLFRLGELLRERKFELCAWMIFEVGKNWAEAYADIAETIDFCEFYAREALRLAKVQPPVQLAGERDLLWYIPLGVGAVIPPWNFPAAIMAGMTLASTVCGNTVVLKPSSDAPTIAAKFFELLEEAGMPAGVVNFCPGAGSSFGNGPFDGPEDFSLYDRCITRGFPGSMLPGAYGNSFQIVQSPGFVASHLDGLNSLFEIDRGADGFGSNPLVEGSLAFDDEDGGGHSGMGIAA